MFLPKIIPRKDALTVPSYHWFVLFILFLKNTSGKWATTLFGYLVSGDDPHTSMKADIEFSATLYGFLNGYAFAFFYAVIGLFAGIAADKYNRTGILTIGLIVWSGALALHGLCEEPWQLVCVRVLLGIGEAFSHPPAISLIASYFPDDRLAFANGFYSVGIYTGLSMAASSIYIDEEIGWRWTCVICGIFGGGVAVLLAFTVREPEREGFQKGEAANVQSGPVTESPFVALKGVLSEKIPLMAYVASALKFLSGLVMGAFMPIFVERKFGPSNGDHYANEFGALSIVVFGGGGVLASFGGGYVGDLWNKKNPGGRALTALAGVALSLPCYAGIFWFENFYACMTCYILSFAFGECWLGPLIGVMSQAVPPHRQGIATAAFFFASMIVGNVGPLIVGALDDHTDAENLDIIMTIAVMVPNAASAVIFFMLATMLIRADSQGGYQPLSS